MNWGKIQENWSAKINKNPFQFSQIQADDQPKNDWTSSFHSTLTIIFHDTVLFTWATIIIDFNKMLLTNLLWTLFSQSFGVIKCLISLEREFKKDINSITNYDTTTVMMRCTDETKKRDSSDLNFMCIGFSLLAALSEAMVQCNIYEQQHHWTEAWKKLFLFILEFTKWTATAQHSFLQFESIYALHCFPSKSSTFHRSTFYSWTK